MADETIGSLSVQLKTITATVNKMSDLIEMVAKHGVTTQYHTERISMLATRGDKLEERVNEVEPVIRQACDIKGKELDTKVGEIYNTMRTMETTINSSTVNKLVAMASVFTFIFGYVYMDYQTNNSEDISRDVKIFEKLDNLIEGQSILKKDVAINKVDISHVKSELVGHIKRSQDDK